MAERTVTVRCRHCDGTGWGEDAPCPMCEGGRYPAVLDDPAVEAKIADGERWRNLTDYQKADIEASTPEASDA